MKYPPRVYLVNLDGKPVLLDEDSVGTLDGINISNVNVILTPWENQNGGISLFIRTMYVEQDYDDDPYAARYRRGE